MIKKVLARLHARHGERIFLEAQRELIEVPRYTPRRIAGYGIACLILALPVGFFALGVWMVFFNSEHMFMILGGLFAFLVAWVIHPRMVETENRTIWPDEMPELFRMINAIADAQGVTPPDGFEVNKYFYAYTRTHGRFFRRSIIGVGMPNWWVRTDAERMAVLAQQIAHFGNGDPQQDRIIGLAFETVLRWEDVLTPQPDPVFSRSLGDMIFEVIQFFLRLPVSLLADLLLYLEFGTNQRATYIADAMAATVVGSDAVKSSLRKNAVEQVAWDAVTALYPYSFDQNARIFNTMAQGVAAMPADQRAAAEAALMTRPPQVNVSTPPDGYRCAFLDALGDVPPRLTPDMFDFDKIARELQPEADRQGRMLMQRFEVM